LVQVRSLCHKLDPVFNAHNSPINTGEDRAGRALWRRLRDEKAPGAGDRAVTQGPQSGPAGGPASKYKHINIGRLKISLFFHLHDSRDFLHCLCWTAFHLVGDRSHLLTDLNRDSSCGHSLPNADGKVLPFLLVELIPNKFTDCAAEHTGRWQLEGTLHDTFRLNIVLPLFQARGRGGPSDRRRGAPATRPLPAGPGGVSAHASRCQSRPLDPTWGRACPRKWWRPPQESCVMVTFKLAQVPSWFLAVPCLGCHSLAGAPLRQSPPASGTTRTEDTARTGAALAPNRGRDHAAQRVLTPERDSDGQNRRSGLPGESCCHCRLCLQVTKRKNLAH
jgi:hypothetical protein